MANPFYKASKEDLVRWLAARRRDLALGKTTSSWSEADTANSHYVYPISPAWSIQLILAELHRQYPAEYPAEFCKRVTRTRIRFNTLHPGPNPAGGLL